MKVAVWKILPVASILTAIASPACTQTCTGATCADRYSLADLRAVTGGPGSYVPADATGHIAGQSDQGRLRALAPAGTDGLLVGIPDASKLILYGAALYLGTSDGEIDGEPGDGFGAAVSSQTQLVVGAPTVGNGPTLPSVGRVYVFPYDRPTLGSGTGDAAQTVTGTVAADALGETVAACGDVDGDGLPDVLAAAPGAGSLAGRVVLLPGGSTATSAADLRGWDGDVAGDLLGHALACADFDGDGLDDAVIGAPYADSRSGVGTGAARKAAGAGSVRIEGKDGEILRIDGSQDDAYLGAGVAVGDLDGDGLPDLLVGASGRVTVNAASDDLTGSVHLFSGASLRDQRATGLTGDRIKDTATFTGDNTRGRFGDTVAVGDVDGDGILDVIIGAPGSNTGSTGNVGAQTGAIYVYKGPFGGLQGGLHDDRVVGDAILTIEGARVYQRVGESLALADLDGSGASEVLFTTREQP